MSKRKPYNQNAGYVASLKCKAPCGGHIVIYKAKEADIDADEPWIVMHEPSSLHIAVSSRSKAYEGMKLAAIGELTEILPT